MVAEAEALIKPNKVLDSFERLEIYNRQYWFRVLGSFADDFPGLRAIVGSQRFEGLMRAYLAECPSQSFSLRNLGSRLGVWLRQNPTWIPAHPQLALDMVELEWAHIEAFDAAAEPILTLADLDLDGEEIHVSLQPYIRLLRLGYAVDDLLIEVHDYEGDSDTSSNAAHLHYIRKKVRYYSDPAQEPMYLAVHRADDSVYYKRLKRESFQLLEAIRDHAPLESAIEAAFAGSSMSEEQRIPQLQQWFGNWAELGWFCRSCARSALPVVSEHSQ